MSTGLTGPTQAQSHTPEGSGPYLPQTTSSLMMPRPNSVAGKNLHFFLLSTSHGEVCLGFACCCRSADILEIQFGCSFLFWRLSKQECGLRQLLLSVATMLNPSTSLADLLCIPALEPPHTHTAVTVVNTPFFSTFLFPSPPHFAPLRFAPVTVDLVLNASLWAVTCWSTVDSVICKVRDSCWTISNKITNQQLSIHAHAGDFTAFLGLPHLLGLIYTWNENNIAMKGRSHRFHGSQEKKDKSISLKKVVGFVKGRWLFSSAVTPPLHTAWSENSSSGVQFQLGWDFRKMHKT